MVGGDDATLALAVGVDGVAGTHGERVLLLLLLVLVLGIGDVGSGFGLSVVGLRGATLLSAMLEVTFSSRMDILSHIILSKTLSSFNRSSIGYTHIVL